MGVGEWIYLRFRVWGLGFRVRGLFRHSWLWDFEYGWPALTTKGSFVLPVETKQLTCSCNTYSEEVLYVSRY